MGPFAGERRSADSQFPTELFADSCCHFALTAGFLLQERATGPKAGIDFTEFSHCRLRFYASFGREYMVQGTSPASKILPFGSVFSSKLCA